MNNHKNGNYFKKKKSMSNYPLIWIAFLCDFNEIVYIKMNKNTNKNKNKGHQNILQVLSTKHVCDVYM
jgi:hypothetical protein